MATKTESEREFRIRPRRPRTPRENEAFPWSPGMRTVVRYARSSRRRQKRRSHSASAGRRQFNQRCAVRVMYSPNRTTGQWRAHGRYITRDSVMQGHESAAIGNQGEVFAPPEVLDRWQKAGDPRLWKMIISPEFGERIDLNRLTRDLMGKMEKDLNTRLEWLAVPHFNTEHPHVHVAMRGIKADGSPLDLNREYIRNGIRSIAEDLCTGQIGHRNQVDAMTAERREVQECRYTSLDRMINRANGSGQVNGSDDAGHFIVRRNVNGAARGEFAKIREQHIAARLIVLHKMGLAEQTASGEWRVRRDFEGVLRAMQRAGDRQKMLAAHGALLSDERLQLVVLDQRTLTSLEGRVLVHGEGELGSSAGRHYILIEGTDASVHLVYYSPALEEARSRGQLRPNSFVRLWKQFENGRGVLEVDDLGDAEKLLRNRRYLEATVRPLVKQGVIPAEAGWSGWLGRYQAALARAAVSIQRADLKERHREPQAR